MTDWAAVARAVDDRLVELGWSQVELVKRSGVGRSTVREIHQHTAERRRNTATMQALSRALKWPEDRLLEIATSESASSSARGAAGPGAAPATTNAELVRRLERLSAELQEVLELARLSG